MKEKHTIQIDARQCIGCGLCQKNCPAGNIVIENKKARSLTQHCILCGHCAAICPKAAVSMTGFTEPPMEIDGPVRLDPQRLLGAIKTRRSIRQFTQKPIEPEIIAQIIEAGRLTPTGSNKQEVSYIVLQNDIEQYENLAIRFFKRMLPLAKLVQPLARQINVEKHFFFKNAPAAIMVLSKDKIDGALAASNMALMAEACGLGVLYSGFFSMAARHCRSLRRQLGFTHGDNVVTTLVLGYSSVTYHRTAQKEAASVRWL